MPLPRPGPLARSVLAVHVATLVFVMHERAKVLRPA
jgi:hypothetical protein